MKYWNYFKDFWEIFANSPNWYKLIVTLTVCLILMSVFFFFKIKNKHSTYDDLIVEDINVFIEPQYKERTLSLNIKKNNPATYYIIQVRLTIYDNQNKNEPLSNSIKTGHKNQISNTGENFKFILDNGKTFFDLSTYINNHEYMLQSYKFIIIINYKTNLSNKVRSQKFEYLYNANNQNMNYPGKIRNFPGNLIDGKVIHEDISY